MKRKELKGIIPALITPFDKDENIDIPALKNLVEILVSEGVHGLFIAGTNGEAHLMSHDEVVLLTKTVVEQVAGRIPVCSGAGRCSTKETIQLANRLVEAGADYISLVSPYYMVPSQEELYQHYKEIAKNVNAPLLLYNIPSQTGIEIGIEIAEKLASLDNICGIKDSGGDFEKQKEYIRIQSLYDFTVLNGSDSLILKSLEAGAKGTVAATANVLGDLEVKLYDYYIDGNIEKAQNARNHMDLLRTNLKRAVAPSVMKKTLNLMGRPVGLPRRPIRDVSSEITEDLKEMIKEYNNLLV